MNDNIRRCLKNVVSLDGWIGCFAEDDKANVHVDVVFRESLFGESANDKVTFKLKLKRAEVFLVVENQDPIKVVRSTIARTVSDATISQKQESMVETAAKATATGKFNKKGISGSLEAKGRLAASEKTTKISEQAIREFIIQHFTDGSTPAWEISGLNGKSMTGSPWDASNAPRLKVKRKSSSTSHDQLTIKLELRCKRQDLAITDIEFVDKKKVSLFSTGNYQTQKIVAAEQLIKDELIASGLLANGDLSRNAVTLLIADTIIFEED